jgi:type II secretory pathway component PulK
MIAQDLVHRQQELAPKDSLAAFAESWVALRQGHVIAQARTMSDLLQRDDVTGRDAVIYVSSPEFNVVF